MKNISKILFCYILIFFINYIKTISNEYNNEEYITFIKDSGIQLENNIIEHYQNISNTKEELDYQYGNNTNIFLKEILLFYDEIDDNLISNISFNTFIVDMKDDLNKITSVIVNYEKTMDQIK